MSTRRARDKGMDAVAKLLPPDDYVQDYAIGRANARFPVSAGVTIAVIVVLVVFFAVVLHGVLVPGLIPIIILYSLIFPLRSIAVTRRGVVLLDRSVWNGRPHTIVALLNHSAILNPEVDGSGQVKPGVRLGPDVVRVKATDLSRLHASASAAATALLHEAQQPPPAWGWTGPPVQSPPPPPPAAPPNPQQCAPPPPPPPAGQA